MKLFCTQIVNIISKFIKKKKTDAKTGLRNTAATGFWIVVKLVKRGKPERHTHNII